MRDVFRLLAVSLMSSCAVAFAGVLMGVADHAIKPSEYLHASITWWVGDAVTLASLTPFLLVYVMPWLLRFCRVPVKKRRNAPGEKKRCVTGCTPCWCGSNPCCSQQASANTVDCVSGELLPPFRTFLSFFLPIILDGGAPRLRGATAGILALNFGIIALLRMYPQDNQQNWPWCSSSC